MRHSYVHNNPPALSTRFLAESNVKVRAGAEYSSSDAMRVCFESLKLAERLGVFSGNRIPGGLPYDPANDSLVFSAPLTSALANKRMLFLRGLYGFDSCIKGFNTLGLMAQHTLRELNKIRELPANRLDDLKVTFLRSRENSMGEKIFSAQDLSGARDLSEISLSDLAIWSAFAGSPIYCSTSSNMGITTHRALRLMQQCRLSFRGKELPLLNGSEGRLVIWAPDRRADFMNEEKAKLLESIQEEQPPLTSIHCYINRQDRDPGALQQALMNGGYFFPTNPQSAEEMQNLLFVALKGIETSTGVSRDKMLANPNIQKCLESIEVEIEGSTVIVDRGVESGLFGLMAPYVIQLEEYLEQNLGVALSTWNQASIGAALAAAVLADEILRDPAVLDGDVKRQLKNMFPAIDAFLATHRLGTDIETYVHGVFDTANHQSLAQLLGVVVEDHISGRGTAYVGLGSSSYSNGNRCFEILKHSIEIGAAFRDKSVFHPATHAVNPFAQALVFGEDMYRYLDAADPLQLSPQIVRGITVHAQKPEPAGAAALAGYLLTRLDNGTLSVIEIAYVLKLTGFTTELFLEFAGYGLGSKGLRSAVQQAWEEGPNMGNFTEKMLALLDWPLPELQELMRAEKAQSGEKYSAAPLDPLRFEALNGPTSIYLTGDNCLQPSTELVEKLAANCWANRDQIKRFIDEYCQA
jgi:hypothetical protein